MPKRKPWTPAECRKYGRIGGLKRKGKKLRSDEYNAGYSAGWNACEKFWRREREAKAQA